MLKTRAPEFFGRRKFVLRGWLRTRHAKWRPPTKLWLENSPVFHLQQGRKIVMMRRVTNPAASVVMLHKWRDMVARTSLVRLKMLFFPVQYGAQYGVSTHVLRPLWEKLDYRPFGERR